MNIENEYPDRRYVVFNVSEIPNVDFSQVFETNSTSLRKSSDKTQTFVKYDMPQPSSIVNLTTKSQEYTYDEMMVILSGSTWTPTVPNIPV